MNAEVKSNLIDITQQTLTSIFGEPKGAKANSNADAPQTKDEALTMKNNFMSAFKG